MAQEYLEPEKVAARTEALTNAVNYLTIDRYQTTIARPSYVRDIIEHFKQKNETYDIIMSSKITEATVFHWEKFYESIVPIKNPRDLKVAYLCGPNPENDIDLLISLGVLPENIWAFESDKSTYERAIVSAQESKYRFVKIFKGKFESYLNILPVQFDLIYLDFCSSIFGRGALSVVRDVFYYFGLSPLGIVVTNFAFPFGKDDELEKNEENIKTICSYLYPKVSLDIYSNGEHLQDFFCETDRREEEFLEMVRGDLENYYGQFITRLLFDLASVIVPYQRFTEKQHLVEMFFKEFAEDSLPESYFEDRVLFPYFHSVANGVSALPDKIKSLLSIGGRPEMIAKRLQLMSYFLGEELDSNFLTEKFKLACDNWKCFEQYVFCDVFAFHQLKDVLIGQLSSPYFYNASKTLRWTYRAKTNRMYMDMIVFDQARYLFDWMPTIDMFFDGVEDEERTLIMRFVMDSITKQRRWYNEEFFYGCAVVDQNTKGFEAASLSPRKVIN